MIVGVGVAGFLDYVVRSFFFYQQMTAYEVRISDWSSDVCSSDLKISALCHRHRLYRFLCFLFLVSACDVRGAPVNEPGFTASARAPRGDLPSTPAIGRAPCRARVCQYV